MNFLRLGLLSLFLFFELGITAQGWITVKDVDFGYRVDFPGNAEQATQEIPTAQGSVTMHSYSFTGNASDKNVIYMSSFTEYPKSFFPDGLNSEEAKTKFFDGAVNGAVTNVNGKLLSDESIVFNGYPGRQFKIELNQGLTYVITMWSLLVDYRFYMIQTISKKEDTDNEDSRKFIDSFELIKVKE